MRPWIGWICPKIGIVEIVYAGYNSPFRIDRMQFSIALPVFGLIVIHIDLLAFRRFIQFHVIQTMNKSTSIGVILAIIYM